MTRSYSRTQYYDTVAGRRNLHLLVRHYVGNMTFQGKKIEGVNILSRDDGTASTHIKARREVILAAGAVHTPQILQLSGIGPAKLLKDLGIGVVEDLPGVGANFQDHPFFIMGVTCKRARLPPSSFLHAPER